MAQQEQRVRQSFHDQAWWCEQHGSPFTALLLRTIEPLLDTSTNTARTILGWQGVPDAFGDAVALRLAGALHWLVRKGELVELAKLYPPNPPPSAEALKEAVAATLRRYDRLLRPWLDRAPQTNEVARSSLLFSGLMVAANRTRPSIELLEIGTSAGLNLNLDRYGYRFGQSHAGDRKSRVQLTPLWEGPDPPPANPVIVSRRGCDLAPLDPANPSHRERLIAYVWPDQTERLQRIQAALDIASENPPKIDRAEAADWVEVMIGFDRTPGIVRVLMHSIAFQYFPEPTKQRIRAHMERIGANATADSPLAWLAFEEHEDQGPHLTLRIWPGAESHILATADPHGRKVTWKYQA